MTVSATLQRNVLATGVPITRSATYSGGRASRIDEDIADGQTDKLIVFTLDVSALALLYIVSDQVITIETNSAGTPDDTLVMVAGEPYIWHPGSLDTNLLTTDVTALYITNASGATANLVVLAITDPTP